MIGQWKLIAAIIEFFVVVTTTFMEALILQATGTTTIRRTALVPVVAVAHFILSRTEH